jgi:hypothetical protein
MKNQLALVMFVFAAFAVAEGARYVSAQATIAPSQTTPSQNPSQTTPTPSPARTTPGQNPSQTVPPLNLPTPNGLNSNAQGASAANPAFPVPPAELPGMTGAPALPDVPLIVTPNPDTPRGRLSAAQLTNQIRTAITQGPNASNGQPAQGLGGIPVTDLRITPTAGKVVLTGIVHSEKDKADAEARAAAIAGEQNVVNELIVR